MMPIIDGFSLAEKTIKVNPEIPFIFLTAKKLKEDKIIGLKLGADDYIVKPFEADELILRLQNILKRSLQKIKSGLRIIRRTIFWKKSTTQVKQRQSGIKLGSSSFLSNKHVP